MGFGNWFSANDESHVKNTGEVNNNVVVETGGKFDKEILILTAIICGIKIFEFIVYIYKHHTKLIKQRHEKNIRRGDNPV